MYKPVGEFVNERQDTCVDITLNDWLLTPPGSELWILCNSSTKELLLSFVFLTLASSTNLQLSVFHLHVYFMPCSVKIKIVPLVIHFKGL